MTAYSLLEKAESAFQEQEKQRQNRAIVSSSAPAKHGEYKPVSSESYQKAQEILHKNLPNAIEEVAALLGLEYLSKIDLERQDFELLENLTFQRCAKEFYIPYCQTDNIVYVLALTPFIGSLGDALTRLFKKNIQVILTKPKALEDFLSYVFEKKEQIQDAKSNFSDNTSEGDDAIEGLTEFLDLLDQDDEQAPIRKEVSAIFRRGITEKSSDIHIEPTEDKVSIRFRLDGKMTEMKVLPKKYQSSLLTYIKLIAKLDIAESRIPQDGRISLKVGSRDVDVRVSVLPIKFGERIVMRLLDKSKGLPTLTEMKLPQEILLDFQKIIKSTHGIVLVTGPTGSGKTTLLAGALMEVNKPDTCIITVEDPVEIQIPGVNQVEVNEKVGLTFASALRSILRQNPNIILIGEIRDGETANIAIKAAMTGHLVFSTLHTNDTTSSIIRLMDYGIEKFYLTSTILGILATRLLRKLCPDCKVETNYGASQLVAAGMNQENADHFAANHVFYKQSDEGCPKCRYTGFSGRLGVYEFLVFDEDIVRVINTTDESYKVKNYALEHKNFITLRDSALKRVLSGETSLEEAVLSTQADG
jgi:general secretion pathway protein E